MKQGWGVINKLKSEWHLVADNFRYKFDLHGWKTEKLYIENLSHWNTICQNLGKFLLYKVHK